MHSLAGDRLGVLKTINVRVPIHTLAITEHETHIMLGLRDGKLIILTVRLSPRVERTPPRLARPQRPSDPAGDTHTRRYP